MKTVADMREVAKRMDITGVSRLNKSELFAVIHDGIGKAHIEALGENALFDARKVLNVTPISLRVRDARGFESRMDSRIAGYSAQRNGGTLTARQYRRIGKKARAFNAKQN